MSQIGFIVNTIVPLLIFLAALAIPVLLLGRMRWVPKNAPRYNRASRITDTLILFMAAGLVFAFIAFVSQNTKLPVLDQLRPALAATYMVVIIVAVTGLLLAAVLTFFGRTSWAVVLTITLLYGYSLCVNNIGSGTSYLMTLIAPKDSWEPIVNYTFELDDTVEGADLWINEIYMGKMPVKISGREFHKKVPFLKNPPKGYDEKRFRDGDWFILKMRTVKGKKSYDGSIRYRPQLEDYYCKFKLGDKRSTFSHVHCHNRSRSMVYYDFPIKISTKSPSKDKARSAKRQRFENLVQKARLSDYAVTDEWFETVDTYSKNERGWRDIQRLAVSEEGFRQVSDKWVIWKYQIDKKEPHEVFERICTEANTSKRYDVDGMAGIAVEIIYEKLDVEGLIGRYERALKLRDQPRSVRVVGHALELWNRKLCESGDDKDNIVQQRIVPASICWFENIETAAKLGGSVIEKYLLRQFNREQRVSGFTVLDWKDRYSYQGLHLNKWLFHLCKLDGPAGMEFRRRNRHKVMELADVMITGGHGNAREAPGWLFLDMDEGTKSVAYEYWPKYYAAMESSWPPWDYEKLKKRWAYLAKLGSAATFEMYMDCWWKIRMQLLDEHLGGDKLAKVVEVIPHEMRVGVIEAIIRDLETSIEAKMKKVLSDWRKRERRSTGDDSDTVTPVKPPGPFYFDESGYIWHLKKHLAESGDEQMQGWWAEQLRSDRQKSERRQLKKLLEQGKRLEHPMVRVLAEHSDSELRVLVLPFLRKYPTRANRRILEKLLEDPDEEVRTAAQEVKEQLKVIEEMFFEELMSAPKKSVVAPGSEGRSS